MNAYIIRPFDVADMTFEETRAFNDMPSLYESLRA